MKCQQCGKEFVSKGGKQRFCGLQCSAKSTAVHKKCGYCGRLFAPSEWGQAYCNDKCREAKRRNTRSYQQELKSTRKQNQAITAARPRYKSSISDKEQLELNRAIDNRFSMALEPGRKLDRKSAEFRELKKHYEDAEKSRKTFGQ